MIRSQIENKLNKHGHPGNQYHLYPISNTVVKVDNLIGDKVYLYHNFRQWSESPVEIDLEKTGYGGVISGGDYSDGYKIYAFWNEANTEFLGFGAVVLGTDPASVSPEYMELEWPEVKNNVIINGGMDIWQRDTDFSPADHLEFTADRWRYAAAGGSAGNISRSGGRPSKEFNYSIRYYCTTPDTSIAASDRCYLMYKVEGYDFKALRNKRAVFSFWIKSTKTGMMSVAFKNSGSDRTLIKEVSIDTASTWEYKFVTINFDEEDGTWDYENGTGLSIQITFLSGSTYQTSTTDEWVTGNYLASDNQDNFCSEAGIDIRITGVQLIEGSIPLPFQHRSIAEEVELCQRYFEKSYNLEEDLGTTTKNGSLSWRTSGSQYMVGTEKNFKTRKRSNPTMTWYSTDTGNADKVWNNSTSADVTVDSTAYKNENSPGWCVLGSTPSSGQVIYAHWTADAEL